MVFLESSRYFGLKTVNVTIADGRIVKAVVLRRLPPTEGKPYTVKGNDQLDVIANRLYGESTKFWHIADANTELKSNDLMQSFDNRSKTIKVPDR